MIFASDNWAGASDRVIAAVAEAAAAGGPAYGNDPLTARAERLFSEVFERAVAVFFVATGTAANALALAHYARPGAFAFSHRYAHVLANEPGSAALFGDGLRIVGIDGDAGRFTDDALATALATVNPHFGEPVAVSLSEISEVGTAYRPAEIAAIAEVAHAHGLAVHMDGARFAGAVAGLNVAPADLTWRAGVDVMSFGGTKGGCIAADAVVFFDPAAAGRFALARQRAGHTFSKSWFVAAQFIAYLEGGHWLELAGHANAMARRLGDAIDASRCARLALEPDANEVFAILEAKADDALRKAGAAYSRWSAGAVPEHARPTDGEALVRLVASHRTTPAEIDSFAAILQA